jgi:hypothetical protein
MSIAASLLGLGAALAALAVAGAALEALRPEAAAALAAVALIGAGALARRVRARLGAVAGAAERIATGCRGVKLPAVRRDEAGRLLQAIALMARSIEALEARSWMAAQDLETARLRIEELEGELARGAPARGERRPATPPSPPRGRERVLRTRHREA